MEGWRDGDMERWRDGEMERLRDGEMEGWMDDPFMNMRVLVFEGPVFLHLDKINICVSVCVGGVQVYIVCVRECLCYVCVEVCLVQCMCFMQLKKNLILQIK